MDAPLLDDDLGFPKAVEDLAVQEFVPELAVEGLAVAVLRKRPVHLTVTHRLSTHHGLRVHSRRQDRRVERTLAIELLYLVADRFGGRDIRLALRPRLCRNLYRTSDRRVAVDWSD